MENITEFLTQYDGIILLVLAPLLEFLLRAKKSKKPLSIADKVLAIFVFVLKSLKQEKLAALITKVRELLNKAIPDRLKD